MLLEIYKRTTNDVRNVKIISKAMENAIKITDLTFDEVGLIHYVPNTTRLRVYIGWMKQCRTIRQLMDRVIYIMLLTEKYVTKDTADKKDFYESCLPFITHICISIPVTTWRDNVYRVWEWINQNNECKAIIAHKNDRTSTFHIPAGPDGTANILFKASSLAMFDFIKCNAELENLQHTVIAPKTLAELRNGRHRVRTVLVTGRVDQVTQFVAPMVKLVEERKVSVWAQTANTNLGTGLVKSPRFYDSTAKTKDVKAKNIARMLVAEHFGPKE